MTNEEIISKATALFRELGLTTLKIRDESSQFEIVLKKEAPAQNVVAAPISAIPAAPTEGAPAETAGDTADSGLDVINAPLVGIFYAAPAPDQPAFVRPGAQVKKGDVLCIIEAMKMMNEIKADYDCEIAEVCADNGNLVEFGQMLFKVKR